MQTRLIATSSPRRARHSKSGVRTIRRGITIDARQHVGCRVGISAATCGAEGISMQQVTLPPGAKGVAHLHLGSESAMYVLSGHAITYYGPNLEQSTITGPGEFLYIPPEVPHLPCNLSDTEPVVAIVARTDASDQERVVLYEGKASATLTQ